MSPFPWAPDAVLIWRLDTAKRGGDWDSGRGAEKSGGRWNPVGYAAVYCSVDPATAILEVAVHKQFDALDRVPHVLTCAKLVDPNALHIVMPNDVPNSNWLRPGTPSAGQQEFGRDLMEVHAFIAIPSAVSQKSWNIVFNPTRAAGAYTLIEQTPFALDTRLNPP